MAGRPVARCGHALRILLRLLFLWTPSSPRVSRREATRVGAPRSPEPSGLSGPSCGRCRSFGLVSTSQPATDGGHRSAGGALPPW